ncbi:nucleotidyltransferase [Kocuria rosea]|uniref:nucleotidyltransferase domain-containing protein n=1 Tax=Kocuria rosea TaxID=1275 RepID=UPI002330519E|nr:nucleotidyltransferase [Kocuria rosea]
MSWTTEYAFSQFYDAINLPGDHHTAANARKDWIVSRLKAGGLNVIDAFSMGSIPRYTALRQHADLDVMVALHYGQHIKDRTPAQVLSITKTALGAGAGAIRRNGQAITIKFQTWPNVDVVPAKRMVSDTGAVTGYQIPDMNRGLWLPTNPPLHSRQISDAASTRGPRFRQAVKMIKHWNRRQDVRLQSYHIEVIALNMSANWQNLSWPLLQWFEAAQPAVHSCWHAGADVSSYLDYSRAARAATQLASARETASAAWYAATKGDHRRAITLWKSVFGQEFPSYG